jgi:O-acetyl-ADP-ribose deacetylase (regulator of RNase III)
MVEYLKGNILHAKADALVNAVNTVGVMGAGLALQFKRAFPAMELEYIDVCRQGELSVGKLHVWDTGIKCPRLIINFPTKQHWRQPSKMEYIQDGLKTLIDVIKTDEISSIAIPPLGCGLGGLDWVAVEKEITTAFETWPDVQVYIYPPR